jgi:hypothetical protein
MFYAAIDDSTLVYIFQQFPTLAIEIQFGKLFEIVQSGGV